MSAPKRNPSDSASSQAAHPFVRRKRQTAVASLLLLSKPNPLRLRFGFAVVATADSLRGRCVGVIDYVVPAKPMHGLCGFNLRKFRDSGLNDNGAGVKTHLYAPTSTKKRISFRGLGHFLFSRQKKAPQEFRRALLSALSKTKESPTGISLLKAQYPK